MYKFMLGIGDRLYAVFESDYSPYDYQHLFPECSIVCYNGFENAFDITHWAWG